jgi:hypothetical protein
VFRATDILSGRAYVDGSPHRYIVVAPANSVSSTGIKLDRRLVQHAEYDEVLGAVEVLEGRGWEVVGIDEGCVAHLRRARR